MGTPVSPEELPFQRPAELHYAAKQNAAHILALAGQHSVPLTQDSIGKMVALASAAGYIPTAEVRIGERTVIDVVDSESFAASMETFIRDVATGRVALPAESSRRKDRTATLTGLWHSLMESARRKLPERFVLRRPEMMVELAAKGALPAAQRPAEIGELLRLVHQRGPRVLLEIGTNYGGTAWLLSRYAPPDALLTTCDIECKMNRAKLEQPTRRNQRIQFLQVDSHSESGAHAIRAAVADAVDLLFIDGDHSYEGVRQDFLAFADLLRPDGLLVFHDIVEDYRTRFGIATNAYVGGVPRFWRELRDVLPSSFRPRELVDSRDQDGLGIGVVICPDIPSPGRVLIDAYLAGPHGRSAVGS